MLEYAALALLIIMMLFIIYPVIYIHNIPYEIAKERGHPHQDVIHIAGWVSMFLVHSIWPFLWIWASRYKPGTCQGKSIHCCLFRHLAARGNHSQGIAPRHELGKLPVFYP